MPTSGSSASKSKFNFFHDYSVILDHPIDEVFHVLGSGDGMERVVRLSDLCVKFELGDRDAIHISDDVPLSQSYVRTLPSSSSDATQKIIPRRRFCLHEAVPVFFGVFTKQIKILGTQTWDEDLKIALYESVTSVGVEVWKLRSFEDIQEGGLRKTRVSENIRGKAPVLLRSIVQKETSRSHRSDTHLPHRA